MRFRIKVTGKDVAEGMPTEIAGISTINTTL